MNVPNTTELYTSTCVNYVSGKVFNRDPTCRSIHIPVFGTLFLETSVTLAEWLQLCAPNTGQRLACPHSCGNKGYGLGRCP